MLTPYHSRHITKIVTSELSLGELGNPSGVVPIGNEDVPIGIDKTAMGCAEDVCMDVMRIEFVLRPLRFQWIIA